MSHSDGLTCAVDFGCALLADVADVLLVDDQDRDDVPVRGGGAS
jgi:hypothetical protein